MPLNILTVDVEDWYQSSLDILGPEHACVPRPVFPGESVVRNTRRLLGIFKDHGVRATCFILGTVAERFPGLVQEIAAAGHEIASHGYSHRLVYQMSPAEFRADVERSLELTDAVLRGPARAMRGYRAPCFSITRKSEWALSILAELGFEYDSSVFPIRRGLYGIPDWETAPHRLRTAKGGLYEFPIATCRLLGKNVPVGGGGYFRLLPYLLTRSALRRVNQRRGPAVFYLHPYELDAEELKSPLPGETRRTRWARLTQRLNRQQTEAKLRRLLSAFRWTTVQDWLKQNEAGDTRSPAGDVQDSARGCA